MSEPVLLIDDPAPRVRRLTLNRPEKRNALNDAPARGAVRHAARRRSRPHVSVMIVRGAGSCFSAGYDLGSRNPGVERSISTVDGWWSRHVVNNWFEMWDMATPIIGQVHGYCLAGGSELATACDLVYVADDAQIGYPPVRLMSPPDMQWQTWMMGLRRGMEALLTGDSMSGTEAVEPGSPTRPSRVELEAVLAIAERIAKVPRDLLALNKRSPTGRWRRWASVTACARPPTSRRSASTSRHRATTSRPSPRRASPRRSAIVTASSATTASGPPTTAGDVRVVVLGSGTPIPTPGRAGAAVAIVDGSSWVLIDCGRATTQRALDAGLDLTAATAVLLTHHHSDHLSDLATFAITRWTAGATTPLPVIAPAGPAARYGDACLSIFDDDCFHGQARPACGPRPRIAVSIVLADRSAGAGPRS